MKEWSLEFIGSLDFFWRPGGQWACNAARRFPSPQPSPPGRGGVLGSLSTIEDLCKASMLPAALIGTMNPTDGVSLSPGERAGVRGKSAHESRSRSGGSYRPDI